MKKKLFCIGMMTLVCASALSAFETNVYGQEQNEQETQNVSRNNEVATKKLFSLKRNEALKKAGTSKGDKHDKQDIGLILKAGSSIQVRQVNPQFEDSVKMELLGDSSKIESDTNVDASWQTVRVDADVAVFFQTPFDSVEPEIEYKIIGSTTPLPTYENNGNENEFFKNWDQNDASYALIKSDKLQLLVPKYVKEKVRHLEDFSSIDSLLNHYDDVFDSSNKDLGLDNSTKDHEIPENRYFMKEDKDTSSGGYYGGSYTAAAGDSFEDFWLKEIAWGQLHEINHGYQPEYNSIGIYTGEVSNNLYNLHYLKNYHGNDVIEQDWLFDYGKKEESENQVEEGLNNGLHYSKLGYGHRPALILLAMIDQKAGDDGLKHLNQTHRESYSNKTNKVIPLQDRLLTSYGEVSQFDYAPAIQRWNVPVSQEISSENIEKNYRPVAHLDHVVPKERQNEVMQTFKNKGLISSRFQVVDNDDISFLNLTGDATIKFKEYTGNKIEGQTVTLKDGAKVIASEKVNNNEVTFKNIPNGVYSVTYPELPYDLTNNYVYVKDKENTTSVEEAEIYSFNLLGIGDDQFATISINTVNDKYLNFEKDDREAHSYFKNEKYVGVTIYRNDEKIYEKMIDGTDSEPYEKKVPLQTNDVIEIFHAETKDRLQTENKDLINRDEKTQYFQVKEGHLETLTNPSPGEDRPEKPENLNAVNVTSSTLQLTWDQVADAKEYTIYRDNKKISTVTENQFDDSNLEENTTYSYEIESVSADGTTSGRTNVLNVTTKEEEKEEQIEAFKFLGFNNEQFATLSIQTLNEKYLHVEKNGEQPHYLFVNENYVGISVYRNDEKIYEKMIDGTDSEPYEKKVPLQTNDVIEIFHAETKDRLQIENKDLINRNEKTQYLQVKEDHLEKVTTPSPSEREWELGSFSNPVLYTEGEKVSYKGKTYIVLSTHNNYGDKNWAPDKANSLFKLE